MTRDAITDEVAAANERIRGGDRIGGRRELEQVWSRVEGRSAIHECIVAHILADAQDDPADELTWDLRALNAAQRCTDDDVQRHTPSQSIAGFMPSLHMSLAQDYLKLRDVRRSGEHLALARTFDGALADDDYGRMIRGAMERLDARLAALGGSA